MSVVAPAAAGRRGRRPASPRAARSERASFPRAPRSPASAAGLGPPLGAMCALIVAIYPSIEDSLNEITKDYPEALKQAFGIEQLDTVEAYPRRRDVQPHCAAHDRVLRGAIDHPGDLGRRSAGTSTPRSRHRSRAESWWPAHSRSPHSPPPPCWRRYSHSRLVAAVAAGAGLSRQAGGGGCERVAARGLFGGACCAGGRIPPQVRPR